MKWRRKALEGVRWLGSRSGGGGAVLLYHRVDTSENDPCGLCVSPERFAQQMEWLAAHYEVLPLTEFLARRDAGNLERGMVAVTFDDGYLDVLENALPILERFGIPATVFVATGNLGAPFWWDRLKTLVFDTEFGSLVREEENLGELYHRLCETLRDRAGAEVERWLSEKESGGGRIDCPRCVDEQELQSLAEHPLIEIGAHTQSHVRLSSLSPEERFREIADSIETLNRLLSRQVSLFSYPFGLEGRDFEEATRSAVAAAGARYAFAADRGLVNAAGDRFALPRLWVSDLDTVSFARYLRLWTGHHGRSLSLVS